MCRMKSKSDCDATAKAGQTKTCVAKFTMTTMLLKIDVKKHTFDSLDQQLQKCLAGWHSCHQARSPLHQASLLVQRSVPAFRSESCDCIGKYLPIWIRLGASASLKDASSMIHLCLYIATLLRSQCAFYYIRWHGNSVSQCCEKANMIKGQRTALKRMHKLHIPGSASCMSEHTNSMIGLVANLVRQD